MKIVFLNFKKNKINLLTILPSLLGILLLVSLLITVFNLERRVEENFFSDHFESFIVNHLYCYENGEKENSSYIDYEDLTLRRYEKRIVDYRVFVGKGNLTLIKDNKKPYFVNNDRGINLSGLFYDNDLFNIVFNNYQKIHNKSPLIKGRLPENSNEVLIFASNSFFINASDILDYSFSLKITQKVLTDEEHNPIYEDGSYIFESCNDVLVEKKIVGIVSDDFSSFVGNGFFISMNLDEDITYSLNEERRSYDVFCPSNTIDVLSLYSFFRVNNISYSDISNTRYIDILYNIKSLGNRVINLITIIFVPVLFIGLFILVDRQIEKNESYMGILKAVGYNKKKLIIVYILEYLSYFILSTIISFLAYYIISMSLFAQEFSSVGFSFFDMLNTYLLGTLVSFSLFFVMTLFTVIYYFKKDPLNLLLKN